MTKTPPITPNAQDWLKIESAEHDRIYAASAPQPIDMARFWAHEDYCYKSGARRDRGHRTRRALELMTLDRLADKRVIDVGCGDGRYGVFLALHGAIVFGFDLSPVGIDKAVQLAHVNNVADRCQFFVATASAIPIPTGIADYILLHEVLHHAIKYPGIHDELLRVLKPGGKAVITETLYGNWLVHLGRRLTMRGHEAQGDVVLRLQDLFAFAAGFSTVHIELMSLTFMAKRVVERWVDVTPVRIGLMALKRLDDILLRAAPSLRRYCSECVAVLVK